MYNREIRVAVAQYLDGTLSEEEAARRADISRARLRHYARTCGAVVPAPTPEGDEQKPA